MRSSVRSDRRGSAGVEAALAVSLVLVPLSLGMADMGATLATSTRLDRALQSALFHVWANPGSYTSSSISQAASASYGSVGPTLSVTSSTACSCVSSSYNPIASVACTASCPTGQTRATYLTIGASTSYTLPAPIPGVTSPRPLSVQGTIRVQ
jgi:Flp pilus assembly protein TadG